MKYTHLCRYAGIAVREVVPMASCEAPADEQRLAGVAAAVPSLDEADALATLFKLLGDGSRARLLYALLETGELCVGDLAAVLAVSETSVSQALRLLRTSGVVRNRREGRHVLYRLDDAHVRALLDLSREHLRHTGTESIDG